MAISKERKQELLAFYEQEASNSRAIIFTEYRGLATPLLGRLRTNVREAHGSFSVIKLTLFKLALENAGLPVPDELLAGPVGVSFCHQDVPAVTKALRDFRKDNELFVITGGIMGSRVLSTADVEAIADLPPLEIVRAQLMGMINSSARNLAGVIAGGVRQVMNVLNAYAERDAQEVAAEA